MSMNDLTADLLTRIRNAVRNHAAKVDCINNRLNRGVTQVLVNEGYLTSFEVVEDGRQGILRIQLKYGPRGEQILNQVDRVSTVGRRVYSRVEKIPRPLQGLGTAIISTSRGVMSDRQCRKENVGGEVIAIVS